MSLLIELKADERRIVEPLFRQHRPSCILYGILQGHQGLALTDDRRAPHVAQLAYADVVYLGGDANHPGATELAAAVPVNKGIMLEPGDWRSLLLAVHGLRVVSVTRYAFSGQELDVERLRALSHRLPTSFHIQRIELDLAQQIAADSSLISEDHVRNFGSAEAFMTRGIGFCVLQGERIVSGASSYAVCDHGIEVQVNTNRDFQGRGLATAVSAALLTYCLEQGLEPHWDAANETSARLADRLGYVAQGQYEMLVRLG